MPDDQPGFDLDRQDTTPEDKPVSPLYEPVMAALRTVFDPEIPVNLVELGLIYDVVIGEDSNVKVEMTLTSPSCPVAEGLPGEVEQTVRSVEGVNDVTVELVWEPIWHPDLMSEEARLQLGML